MIESQFHVPKAHIFMLLCAAVYHVKIHAVISLSRVGQSG
jgi:S-adenosylmethionine:tRNA-ribosyltransferase-isomerase (queuine synthetase)